MVHTVDTQWHIVMACHLLLEHVYDTCWHDASPSDTVLRGLLGQPYWAIYSIWGICSVMQYSQWDVPEHSLESLRVALVSHM